MVIWLEKSHKTRVEIGRECSFGLARVRVREREGRAGRYNYRVSQDWLPQEELRAWWLTGGWRIVYSN